MKITVGRSSLPGKNALRLVGTRASRSINFVQLTVYKCRECRTKTQNTKALVGKSGDVDPSTVSVTRLGLNVPFHVQVFLDVDDGDFEEIYVFTPPAWNTRSPYDQSTVVWDPTSRRLGKKINM